MNNRMHKKLKVRKSVILILFLVITLSTFTFLYFTKSESMDSLVTEFDKPLELGSDLTYYLDVTYDGVDREGVEASKTTLSKIFSDYIYVEDKIPDGLTFKEFEVSEFMTGAQPQGDIDKVCDGYVYDDSNGSTDPANYKGLHYDEATRTVSFRIMRLQAGCHLTVGIVTTLPDTVDDPKTTDIVETRRDFWNVATAWEGSQFATSNLVHAWIESQEATTHKVTYEYDSSAPANAPAYPIQEYAQGASVDLAPEPKVEGYEFLGWTIIDGLSATITNNLFVMPNNDVVIQGRFKKIPKNLVLYEIEGDVPEGYVLPEAKEYYRNSTVIVDSMKENDTFNGYRFSGWTTDAIAIEDGQFIMPDTDITLKGKFEVIKYTVEYKYHGTNVPEGATPPASQEYAPGESVILPHVADLAGYTFLSWDKEDGFIMPAENVVVYGEWQVKTGVFTPTIKKEIVNKKEYYRIGDTVEYKITVTNNATYSIKNVQVKEKNANAKFDSDGTENYKIKSDHVAEILTIPASESVSIKAIYTVTDKDVGTITNEAEIIGALASNNNDLNPDGNYKAQASFKVQSKLNLCKNVDETTDNTVFQFHIVSTDNTYDTWLNMEGNQCTAIYLNPVEYNITEIIPQKYELESIEGISTNGGTIKIEEGKNSTVTFNNSYKKKGYYHSSGFVENIVNQDPEVDYTVNYYYDDILEETTTSTILIGEDIPYKSDMSMNYKDKFYTLEKIEGIGKKASENKEDNIINVYYVSDINNDSIPDKYQITFKYTSSINGTVTGITSEMATIQQIKRDPNTNAIIHVGEIQPVSPTQPSTVQANDGYYFRKWNDGSKDIVNDTELKSLSYTKDTIFTAYFFANPDNYLSATKTLLNLPARGYFRVGESVEFEIAITNSSAIAVESIIVDDLLAGATFVEAVNGEYSINNNQRASIAKLEPTQSVTLKVKYTITRDDMKNHTIKNIARIQASRSNSETGSYLQTITVESDNVPVGTQGGSTSGGGTGSA